MGISSAVDAHPLLHAPSPAFPQKERDRPGEYGWYYEFCYAILQLAIT